MKVLKYMALLLALTTSQLRYTYCEDDSGGSSKSVENDDQTNIPQPRLQTKDTNSEKIGDIVEDQIPVPLPTVTPPNDEWIPSPTPTIQDFRNEQNDAFNYPYPSDQIDLEQIKADYNDTVTQIIPTTANRFLSHIQTDKVVYRPGDVMFIQAYIFDAINKTPAYSDNLQTYSRNTISYQRSFPRNYAEPYVYLTMAIVNPLGEAVYSSFSYMNNSTISFTYIVPENSASGEYQIRMSGGGIPESIRVIRIRQYERQELNIQASFNATVYKPGDFVNGTIIIKPADGSSFLNGILPRYAVVVNFENGLQYIQELQETDANGLGVTTFQIPENYSLNYLSVQITVFYQNIIQGFTATLTVVQIENIYIQFFPETYNYVYDVPNKVYFQAFASKDDEAEFVDIQDAILVAESEISYDADGNPISYAFIDAFDISSQHQGRGNFTFIPRKGVNYYLSISQGDKVNNQYLNVSDQPDIDNLELNFGINNKVIENDEDLEVTLLTNYVLDPRNIYVIGVFNKEQILYLQEYKFEPLQSYLINIDASEFESRNGGVLRLAVFQVINALIWYDRYDFNAKNISTRNLLPNPFFDVYFIPKGELLFFKKPLDHLLVDINLGERLYQPGDYVEFDVIVRDSSTQNPVGYNRNRPTERSFISVIVSDESVNYQLENGKHPPSLPAMVYLEKEIKNVDNQFQNSEDYIDYIYQSQVDDQIFVNGDQPAATAFQNAPSWEESNRNTELLLGVQGWRYGYFYPQVLEEWPALVRRMNASETRQLQNLLAYTFTGGEVYYNVRSASREVFANGKIQQFAGGLAASESSSDQSEATTQSQAEGGQTQEGEQNQAAGSSLSLRELEFWNFLMKFIRCDFVTNTRLYQHAQRFSFFGEESSRFDTTETVFYQAAVLTDREGRYTVRFYLSDLITSFRITANAFDTLGRMGYSRSLLISRSNFYISFQLPQQMTIGDSLVIPVYIYNNFDQEVVASLEINTFDNNLTATFQSNNEINQQVVVSARNQSVVYITVSANSITDNAYIQVRATTLDPNDNTTRVSDSIFRDTTVVSPGVRQSQSTSGFIGPNDPANFVANLPSSMVVGTQDLVAEVYPSSVEALIESLISLIIGTPGPCFICIFNPLYSNLLVLAAAQRSGLENIDTSVYQTRSAALSSQISAFVNANGGVSQFLGGSQDTFLSILYLLQQTYTSEITGQEGNITPVANYLLGLRNAAGTFEDLSIAYAPYPKYVIEAFLVYALTSVGIINELQAEILRLEGILQSQLNQRDANTLFIGLMANIYLNINDTQKAEQYLDFLASSQLQDGSIYQITTIDSDPDRQAFTQFEATAAAVLGWQSNPEKYGANIARGINYLIANIRDRYYGSSIGVILSFNALLNYVTTVSDINGSGEFVLQVNNDEIDRQYFASEDIGVIRFETESAENNNNLFVPGGQVDIQIQVENYIPDTEQQTEITFTEDENGEIVVNVSNTTDDFSVPYFIEVSYDDTNPTSSMLTQLSLEVDPNFDVSTLGSQATQGTIFQYNITLRNLQANNSIGLIVLEFRPASCLQVNFAQLELLKLNNIIDEYQAIDNNSIIQIYFQGLDAGEVRSFQLDFLQTYQGVCTQRPIDAYEFYSPNQKIWVTSFE
eukprot:403359590